MALLFSYAGADPEPWCNEFRRLLPDLEIRCFPDVGDSQDIEYAAVWMHPPGDLCNYPNLKAILSFGAGVEHIIRDAALPANVPIVRLADDRVARDMAMHVLHWVIHFHRHYHLYRVNQANHIWHRHEHRETAQRRVGFLGLGAMGVAAARLVRDMGFAVAGWSKDPVDLDGIEFFEGDEALVPFLARSEIVVNVLPLTPATESLLNRERFGCMPKGACFINVSRGAIVVEEDLLSALDTDHLGAAALDVFRNEPLNKEDPLWAHPRVFVTPHISGVNYPLSAVNLMARNIRRIQAGDLPFPMYDRAQGY
ncbi:2-hydroxyacid dehydrogenase [Caballeronia sp. DA-9]|uniref:2-hydroxyacid dehydrogenase n=1 Tax=Caballeronia sp. DA-9 TaxID=3436237 RepID=UPI003F66DDFC